MNWLRHSRFYVDGTPAVGLLFLRIFAGYSLAQYGMMKIPHPFSWMGPDAPVPGILQALAAVSEFFGGLALIFGVLTPLACFGIMCTMFVAVLSMLGMGAGLIGQKSWNLPGLFFVIALSLFLTGPGILSFDYFVFGRPKERDTSA